MSNGPRRRSGLAHVGGLVVLVSLLGGASAVAGDREPHDDVVRVKGVSPVDMNDPEILLQHRDQEFENDLASLIDKDPAVFSGQRATANSHIVYVKQGVDLALATQQVARVVEKWGIEADAASVVPAPKSHAELTNLHGQVDALLDELQFAGADICGTGPDIVSGKIQVDIEAGQVAAEGVLGDLSDSVHFVPCETTGSPDHGALSFGR